jgi:hypothetical protein
MKLDSGKENHQLKKPLLAVIGLTTFLGVSFAAPKPMLYTGEIEKDGANFVLLNTTTKVAYQLDNQKKAKDHHDHSPQAHRHGPWKFK